MSPLPTTEEPKPKWRHNIWFVLVMLFLVVGPLGLPLVWKNPRFSRRAKIALTLAVIVYTVWLIDRTLRLFRMITEGGMPLP